MRIRIALILMSFVLAITGARGDPPAEVKAHGRVVEGKVVAAGRRPVVGARVLIGEADRGLSFEEGATATTDVQGRYRVDVGKSRWSKGPVHVMALATGFKAGDRTIEANATTADFELVVQPWKTTQVRLEDGSGRPVVGVEVNCSVGSVIHSQFRTDAEGKCRVAIPPEVGLSLSIKAADTLPIEAYLSGAEDESASITIRCLPVIRGRVVDTEGRAIPGVAVGRWLAFDAAGDGEMIRLLTVTDGEGKFVIAPKTTLHRSDLKSPGFTRPDVLCFADASFRRMAYRVFDRARATEPMEVRLGPMRRVRIPIALGSVASKPGAELSSEISIVPRPDIPDLRFFLITRELSRKGPVAGTADRVIDECVPAGTYQLSSELYDADAQQRLGIASRELVVSEGEDPLDLPPLTLEPPLHLRMVGKPAPELSATDLDTGRPATLSDFRGKVIVLDFWGYWCGPCLGNMKHLMELQRKFAGRPLAIVALHDQSVQSRAEYDRKIARARQGMWGGRDLPFRVLLDRPDPSKSDDRNPEGTGITVLRYGIMGFPSLFVIDGNGTMVGQVPPSEHDRLESLVQELLAKAEGR